MNYDLKTRPVKIVYSYFPDNLHISMCVSSKYAVRYIPGEWTKPILSGSKLFFHPNLMIAMRFNRMLRNSYSPKRHRSMGATLWFCDTGEIELVPGIKIGASDRQIENYWEWHEPWSNTPGMLMTDQIMLLHLVDVDSWEDAKELTARGIGV